MSGIPDGKDEPAQKEWETRAKELFPEGDAFAESIFEHEVNRILHEEAVERSARADGRALTEVRSLFAQRAAFSSYSRHGIFYRGGTHVFSALTLGGPRDALLLDGMEVQEGEKRFMHH